MSDNVGGVPDFRAEIQRLLGCRVAAVVPLGGGCVGAVYEITLEDGRRLVAKTDEDLASYLSVEGFMLRYLAAKTTLPVPQVIYDSDHLLLMELVPGESRFSTAAQGHAAELLANLHDRTAQAYGFEHDTVIGGLRQPNPQTTSWRDFFREHRLLYMAGEGLRAGRLPREVYARLVNFCGHLDRWIDEPSCPSLIHGDVWTTNVLAHGDRIMAFLDPAIYFADAEIELAFITLFGTFGASFFERYRELRPLSPGFFEGRRDIYNLYPLLVHVQLFGGSYVLSVSSTLRRFGY